MRRAKLHGLASAKDVMGVMNTPGVSESLKILRLAFTPSPLTFATMALGMLASSFLTAKPRAYATYRIVPGGSPSLYLNHASGGAPDVSGPALQIASAINNAVNRLGAISSGEVTAGYSLNRANQQMIATWGTPFIPYVGAENWQMFDVPAGGDKNAAAMLLAVKVLLTAFVYPYAWFVNTLKASGWNVHNTSPAAFAEGIGVATGLREFYQTQFPIMLSSNRAFIYKAAPFLLDPQLTALYIERINFSRNIVNAFVGDAAIGKSLITSYVDNLNINAEKIDERLPDSAVYIYQKLSGIIGDAIAPYECDIFGGCAPAFEPEPEPEPVPESSDLPVESYGEVSDSRVDPSGDLVITSDEASSQGANLWALIALAATLMLNR